MVYNGPLLKGIFVKGLGSPTQYAMRIYCGARKESTLHSLTRHAKNLVRLQEVSYSPTTSIRKDNISRRRSPKSCRHPTRITSVMALREDETSPSSLSEGKKKKSGTRFKLQNKNKNMPTTAVPSIQQQRALVSRSQENAGFRGLCFRKGYWAEERPVVPLQVSLNLLQLGENNKGNLPSNRNWSRTWRRPPYYLDPFNPSHSSSTRPTGAHGVSNARTVYQTGSPSSRATHKT